MNEPTASSCSIIVIDDDASFRKILERRLASFLQNPELHCFGGLGEAREFLQAQDVKRFDLVILDEHLPDGHGAEFLQEGWFQDLAVLCVSSDEAPEIPGKTLQAGATYFLNKRDVSAPLFKGLIRGLLERNRLIHELNRIRVNAAIVETVKTLVSTLKHEINNPLGAVLGAAYLLKTHEKASSEQKQAAELVETSAKRIKHVLDKLCEAVSYEPVKKANQVVFQIPGDSPWEESEN